MSNDLISRSAVVKIIEDEIKLKSSYVEHNAQIDIMFKVKEMPTAYNVDKVVERLEAEAERWKESGEEYEGQKELGVSEGFKKSIEIVKSGGIE